MSRQILKIIKSKLGKTKKGSRIWIEGAKLAQAGFDGGCEYVINDETNSITLRLTDGAGRKVSSRRNSPIIDIVGQWVTEKFAGYKKVKIIIMDGLIRIKPDTIEMQVRQCSETIKDCFENGKPIPFIDVFTGGATSSTAAEHGAEGLLKTAMHIECDPFYCNLSDQNHPGSTSYNAYVQDVDMDDIPKVPVVFGYWPCGDHSTQGRAKKGLAGMPEAGNEGYLYHYLLEIIRKSGCNTFVGECVPSFQNSFAAMITRKVLNDLGFVYQDEAILRAQDFGDLTKRERFIFAASRLAPITLPRSAPHIKRKLADILEPEPHNWLTPKNSRTMDYLVNEHSVKHQAKGNGFGLLGATHLATDDYMPTISKTYAKIQPSALLRKGPDEMAWRLFTPTEVARAHGIPDGAIKMPPSKTRAYEVLGQGTAWSMFSAIGKMVAEHLKDTVKESIVKPIQQQEQLSLI